MKKKIYEQPSMMVIDMEYACHLLAGSGDPQQEEEEEEHGDPTRNVPWWDGEGD